MEEVRESSPFQPSTIHFKSSERIKLAVNPRTTNNNHKIDNNFCLAFTLPTHRTIGLPYLLPTCWSSSCPAGTIWLMRWSFVVMNIWSIHSMKDRPTIIEYQAVAYTTDTRWDEAIMIYQGTCDLDTIVEICNIVHRPVKKLLVTLAPCHLWFWMHNQICLGCDTRSDFTLWMITIRRWRIDGSCDCDCNCNEWIRSFQFSVLQIQLDDFYRYNYR